ncbi:hypothetical protein BGP83_22925 [Pseudomonas putida]|nr:hypothetical protein BGP83_22925 [Pseudomonas putida]
MPASAGFMRQAAMMSFLVMFFTFSSSSFAWKSPTGMILIAFSCPPGMFTNIERKLPTPLLALICERRLSSSSSDRFGSLV